jgi:membrane-associated phospholipid phosphatase
MSRPHADEPFFDHAERALGLALVLLALVAFAAALVPAGPLAIDQRWSESMHDIRGPVLDDVAHVFDAAGHGLVRALSIAAIGLVLLVARRWLALAAFALTESLAPLASSVIKVVVGRPRPPDALIHPSGASFPSGHVTYAAATSVAVVLLTAPGRRRRGWWGAAALVTAGMAWSRTYLQVHWLSDVVAGAALGVGMALLVFAGVLIVRKRTRSPRRDDADTPLSGEASAGAKAAAAGMDRK